MAGAGSDTPGSMMGRTIVVTGASGFVGRHLVVALQHQGHLLRLVSRAPAPRGDIDGVSTYSTLDRGEHAALQRAMAGADAVVHLAGRAHVLSETADSPITEFRASNVELTRRVVHAALEAGVARFVFFSSVGAVTTMAPRLVTDEFPLQPSTPYGQSKREAEELIRQMVRGTSLSCAILRPPMIYGPGMKGNPLTLMRLVDAGFPLPFGRVVNRRSAAYVGNVVDAVLRLVALERSGVEAYFVKDTEDLSLPELVRVMARALDRPARMFPVPVPVLRLLAQTGDLLPRRLRGRSLRDMIDRLTESLILDGEKLARATGHLPQYSAVHGWTETARWYRAAPDEPALASTMHRSGTEPANEHRP